MNKDLIEFYENEQRKIEKEVQELNEVGGKSPKRVNRLVELDYIIEGLRANEIIAKLRKRKCEF